MRRIVSWITCLVLVTAGIGYAARTFAQEPFGDANGDGTVNSLDYVILFEHFSQSTTRGAVDGDFDSNGKVDALDYVALFTTFGQTRSVSPAPTAGSGANAGESMAMHAFGPGGKNIPNPSRDRCSDGTDIVAVHKTYFVIGPGGKKYPTWHAPVVTNPVTGNGTCSYGHEHGRDPTGYQFWNEIKMHFAYDANGDGQIGTDELASSGIPFGYVNEQLDTYATTNGQALMRHEDHVGHKVEYANGEGDIGDGTDPFDTSLTGGLVVPVKNPSGSPKWNPSGIRCYHFDKFHQGVSSPDALTNNLHEVIFHTKCSSTRSDFPAGTSIISGMVAFGAPGEFTQFCSDDRDQIISLGTTGANSTYPGLRGNGMRNIITRDCVTRTVLVPPGQFSAFPYEIWEGGVTVRTGSQVIASVRGSWEVLDAIRYYNPASATNISYTADWCYETLGDRRARGGACDAMTSYGQITGITWDDPRSLYRGIHRGQYVSPHVLANNGGSTIWYSDPFGGNATVGPFAGAVKQSIAPVEANVIGLFSSDPRIILRNHDSGESTVHAPN